MQAGFTLVEVLAVGTVIAVLLSIATPRMTEFVDAVRARGTLDRLATDLYFARMLAVRDRRSVELRLDDDADQCVVRYRVRVRETNHDEAGDAAPGGALTRVVRAEPGGFCVRHTGGSTVVFNARGLLIPPGKSFFIRGREEEQRLVISIAGRVRRSY